MNTFTIKDLANLSGIKAHTLRIWELRYNFLKPSRTFTNIRYYNNEDLKTILNIAILNKYGFKISHIDKMTEVEIKEKIFSLTALEAQQERIVNEMIQLMIDLEIESFEKILSQHIASKGIEKTITHVIFAFLEKIGILWLTNHINPAQEHLVTNIIRQKLIVGIDTVQTPLKSNKKILLFLPEGEFHELGLLFMYYLLKSRGIYVYYLGTNVPIKDIAYLVKYKKPDYAYCHLTTVGQSFNFEKFLHAAGTQLNNTPFVISGQLTNTYEKKILPPIIFKRSLPEVMEFISGL